MQREPFITHDGTRIPRAAEDILAELLTPRPPRPVPVRQGVLTSAEFAQLLDEVDRTYIGNKPPFATNTRG